MKTVTIDLPDSLDTEEFEIKMLLAGQLYERGKLSLGQAAQLVGISKRSFIEIMGRFGFSMFSDSIEDLYNDIANA
ncbi:UPF0175 family protein [Dyadobacter sp. CY323]|uniref:UPF0175 family protein n=1 Tax=Dyadobacter sp. CY323 TaxID=2907302 RepID=UPI001F441E8D|nr:UPF0175 family protein [Dyadobacter sp. CY323]MCE6989308.1 UPF0175 family protein [Dyadobacter sp. CY323]